MTTKFITPTNEHVGKMIEVSCIGKAWFSRELVHILPEKFINRFICVADGAVDKIADWSYARIAVPKTYAELQAESGLKVGDWVKVVRTAKDYENGWGEEWCMSMNDCIGEIFQIYNISCSNGVSKRGGFSFPYFVLEKTTPPPKPGTAAALKEGDVVLTERGYIQILSHNAENWDFETAPFNPAKEGWIDCTSSESLNVKGRRLKHPEVNLSSLRKFVVHVDNPNGVKFYISGVFAEDENEFIVVKWQELGMKFKPTDLLVVE